MRAEREKTKHLRPMGAGSPVEGRAGGVDGVVLVCEGRVAFRMNACRTVWAAPPSEHHHSGAAARVDQVR